MIPKKYFMRRVKQHFSGLFECSCYCVHCQTGRHKYYDSEAMKLAWRNWLWRTLIFFRVHGLSLVNEIKCCNSEGQILISFERRKSLWCDSKRLLHKVNSVKLCCLPMCLLEFCLFLKWNKLTIFNVINVIWDF